MPRTIDPGASAKDTIIEATRDGTWKIQCQCPQCNHRNQHNGGRAEEPRVGGFKCKVCEYEYIVPLPKEEIQPA